MDPLSRLDVVYVYVPLTAKLADGSVATVSASDVALLPPYVEPDEDTVWSPMESTEKGWRFLASGPDAAPVNNALLVTEKGADVYTRVVDNPEIVVKKVGRIEIE